MYHLGSLNNVLAELSLTNTKITHDTSFVFVIASIVWGQNSLEVQRTFQSSVVEYVTINNTKVFPAVYCNFFVSLTEYPSPISAIHYRMAWVEAFGRSVGIAEEDHVFISSEDTMKKNFCHEGQTFDSTL